jgi:alginate O-acetyltransferase complex protein AlgI
MASFLFEFLPPLLTAYFLVLGAEGLAPRLSAWTASLALGVLTIGSAVFLLRSPFGWLWIAVALATWLVASCIERLSAPACSRTAPRALLGAGIVMNVAAFAWVRSQMPGRTFAFAGATVLGCHAVAFLIDVFHGRATARRPLLSALYLIQFPVLPAGPIVRYQEFSAHHVRVDQMVGLGAFTYGMRRIIIGVVKFLFVAGTLGHPVDAIFALPPSQLGTGSAWLAAIGFSLQLYFQFSGLADMAIGIGRMFGLRYPENFRRPYLADSVREFWRRWNVTAVMWLRDYLSLPMAGRDRPTPRLFANIVIGFSLLALWHGATGNVLVWAVYAGMWLALEAIGLSRVVERAPRALRHAYLLAIVVSGWVILRADTPAAALHVLAGMAGQGGAAPVPVSSFLTWQVWCALAVAGIGAGPLVPWISRWRVTVDAGTAAVVMMLSAVSLWIWRYAAVIGAAFRPFRRRRRASRT